MLDYLLIAGIIALIVLIVIYLRARHARSVAEREATMRRNIADEMYPPLRTRAPRSGGLAVPMSTRATQMTRNESPSYHTRRDDDSITPMVTGMMIGNSMSMPSGSSCSSSYSSGGSSGGDCSGGGSSD